MVRANLMGGRPVQFHRVIGGQGRPCACLSLSRFCFLAATHSDSLTQSLFPSFTLPISFSHYVSLFPFFSLFIPPLILGPVHTRTMQDTCNSCANLVMPWEVQPTARLPTAPAFQWWWMDDCVMAAQKGSCTSDGARRGSCRASPALVRTALFSNMGTFLCAAALQRARSRSLAVIRPGVHRA